MSRRESMFVTELMGVPEGFYKCGIDYSERYIKLLEKLELSEISDTTKKELEVLKKPDSITSTSVFRFEPNLDKRILNAAMRFDVSLYDFHLFKNSQAWENPTREFLHRLPKLLPNYKGEFSLLPEDIFETEDEGKLAAWLKTIERNESHLWPVTRASKDKYGLVLVQMKYEGTNPENRSSIDAYLISDYITRNHKFESDRLFLYTRFTETPFADARLVLESFRDFSYTNCSHLKSK